MVTIIKITQYRQLQLYKIASFIQIWLGPFNQKFKFYIFGVMFHQMKQKTNFEKSGHAPLKGTICTYSTGHHKFYGPAFHLL